MEIEESKKKKNKDKKPDIEHDIVEIDVKL
jgi:hypothetical protein